MLCPVANDPAHTNGSLVIFELVSPKTFFICYRYDKLIVSIKLDVRNPVFEEETSE